MIPSIGRIVHFRIGGTDEDPVLRPALIVRVWSGDTVNVQVFLDGSNDRGLLADEVERSGSVVWCESVTRGDGIGQYRWPHVVAPPSQISTPQSSEATHRATADCG